MVIYSINKSMKFKCYQERGTGKVNQITTNYQKFIKKRHKKAVS